MNNTIHEEEYKGVRIEVYQDGDTDSPESWGNEEMAGWHREFTVKNKHINKDIFGAYIKQEGYEEYAEEAKEVEKKFYIFGVDAYIHSGIRLSMHNAGYRDKWDTSDYVGCILVSVDEVKSHTTPDKEAERIAKGILATWNDYLSGNVYGYNLTDVVSRDNAGGCGGYYGDWEEDAKDGSGLIKQAKSEIDYYVESGAQEVAKRAEIQRLRQQADTLEATTK